MPDFSADLAVVIGIDAYDDAVGRLETPVRDARAIAALLESRFGYKVILRCDGEATQEQLWALLCEELPLQVGEGSRLFFYFAGHGIARDSQELEGPEGFLVPQDATPDIATHLPMSEIRDTLAGLPCRHLLVVLDCCFSGSFHWSGRRPLHAPGEFLYEERYRHWVRHPARWAFASAAHDEYALDIPDRRRGQAGCHSPFAAALLDGLQGAADRFPEGGDGVITLAELYAYVLDLLTPHQSPLLAPLRGQARGEYVFRDPFEQRSLKSAEAEVVLDKDANPYRGLEPYRAGDVELFFGRGNAIQRLLEHVRKHVLTVVVGPSGSGKSSLVEAGLLPCLCGQPDDQWVAPPPLRTGKDPWTALRTALAAAGGPPPPTDADPRQLADWAAIWKGSRPTERLLVVVDQAEELVTQAARSGSEEQGTLPEAAGEFLACLKAIVQAGDGRVRVLVAVRSDYETDLDEGPLASLWRAARFVMPPLTREELRQIVEGPAARKALYFEDPRLVDRLVDEVWGMPGGLPLLSYALSRLYLAYLRAGRGDRLLTGADLEEVLGEPTSGADGAVAPGGIVRALREAADHAVVKLPAETQATLWRVLLRMVSLTGARATRRQVSVRELVYPQEAENERVERIRELLIGEVRLVVSDGDGDSAVIEPAHDELLIAWPELVRRIEAARVHLPVHRRLTEAATDWSARPQVAPEGRRQQPDLDLRLLGLVETSGLPEDWLNKAEADYIAAARRARRRRTALRWSVAVAILLVTTGAALFFRYQSQRNERLRYQAIIQGLANQAAADLGSGQTARGLLLTRHAFEFLPQSRGALANPVDQLVRRALDNFFPPRDKDQESRIDELFRRVLDDLPPSRVALRNSLDDFRAVAFHPSGQLLVAGSKQGLALLTLPQGGIEPKTPPYFLRGPVPTGEVKKVAFSRDSRFLAATYSDNSRCVWHLIGTPPAPVGSAACAPPPHVRSSLEAAQDVTVPASSEVLSTREGSDWVLHRQEAATTRFPYLCEREPTAITLAPDGVRVAVACDGALRLWNLQPGPGDWERGVSREHLSILTVPTVLSALPGNPALPTIGFANGDVEQQDPKTGRRLRFPRPHVRRSLRVDLGQALIRDLGVSALIWSLDGQKLHVFGNDGLWRIHEGSRRVRGRWLRGPVCKAVGSADGAWVAALVKENRRKAFLEIWPTSGVRGPVVLQVRSDLASCQSALAFHPTRNELAFGIRNELIVWKLSGAGVWQPRRIAAVIGDIFAIAWSKELLALGGRGFGMEGIVELLGIDGRLRHRWTVAGTPVGGLAFDPEGQHLVASTTGVGLRIWNLQAPDALPTILGHRARLTRFPVFLTRSRIAALADGGLMVWNLGTKALADAACSTIASNLSSYDWIAYVNPALDQYELTCVDREHGLSIHPSVLAYADSVAWMGNTEYAERVYRRLNELEPRTVVDPVRRARAQKLLRGLALFNATDRQGLLDGMNRAEAYNALRGADLPPIFPQVLLRLCRRGALLGEARRALPFCDQGLELFRSQIQAAPDRLGIRKALYDGRGLARALLGDLHGARADFLQSRHWLGDPAWRARRQAWLDALGAGRNPITSEVLQDIAQEEMGADMPQPHSRGLQVTARAGESSPAWR